MISSNTLHTGGRGGEVGCILGEDKENVLKDVSVGDHCFTHSGNGKGKEKVMPGRGRFGGFFFFFFNHLSSFKCQRTRYAHIKPIGL